MNRDLLASTAVFAELVNEKTDLKEVLKQFILSTYVLDMTFAQSAQDVRSSLKNHFQFDIPDAVIQNLLKKARKDGLLTFESGKHRISAEDRKSWETFADKVENKEAEQSETFDKLIQYVQVFKGPLDDSGKSKLETSFHNYLFDENSEDEHSEAVSAFIIQKKQDKDFVSKLNLIREGIIILRGIKYNPEINEVKP